MHFNGLTYCPWIFWRLFILSKGNLPPEHLVLVLAHKSSEVESSSIYLLLWQD
jgi:hypothetical protein